MLNTEPTSSVNTELIGSELSYQRKGKMTISSKLQPAQQPLCHHHFMRLFLALYFLSSSVASFTTQHNFIRSIPLSASFHLMRQYSRHQYNLSKLYRTLTLDKLDNSASSNNRSRNDNIDEQQQQQQHQQQHQHQHQHYDISNRRQQKKRKNDNRKNTRNSRNSNKKSPQNIKAKSIAKGRDPLISLNMNLDYLAKTGAARTAEELLLRIEKLYDEGYYAAKPDNVSYNSVMYAYAYNKNNDESFDPTKEVLRLFDRMQELSKTDKNVLPNVITLNILIRCFAKNGDVHNAKKLLDNMEYHYQNGSKHMSPNTVTFNTVIDAYAKSKKPEEAEEVLKQMMSLSRTDPDREEIIKADTISFNSVLAAWSSSGKKGSAQRCSQLLEHQIKLYNAGNNDVKPDAYSYTATISAWSTEAQDPYALDKCLELLHKMENSCALGDEDLCPNTVAYTSVISAFARSRQDGASEKAYQILLQMEKGFREGNAEVRPDFIAYSAVINALAKSEEDHAGQRALEILNYMVNLSDIGYKYMAPNTQVYLSVIAALGRSKARGSADAAQKLLNDIERSHALGSTDIGVNTIIFNAVIDGWARSSFIYKADRAFMLLKRMEEGAKQGKTNYQPDIISYNSVILAAANSFGDQKIKSKAFRIALFAFKTIQASSNLQQSSRTYAIFMKAIRKLNPPGDQRDTMVRKVLQFCCRDGLLNQFVLSQVEITCSSKKTLRHIFSKIGYSGENIDLKRMPSKWRTNVK